LALLLGSALPASVPVSEDEFDDYWTCSADVSCNLGTYDAEGQRVVQVADLKCYATVVGRV